MAGAARTPTTLRMEIRTQFAVIVAVVPFARLAMASVGAYVAKAPDIFAGMTVGGDRRILISRAWRRGKIGAIRGFCLGVKGVGLGCGISSAAFRFLRNVAFGQETNQPHQ